MLDDCQHAQVQSLGMNNKEELNFILSRALGWYAQIKYGKVSLETIRKAKEEIRSLIPNFDVFYYFTLKKSDEK